jgi:hypothetical protein
MHFQRSTLRCSACREYVGVGAAFCSTCGASSDDIALGAPADGGIPPNEAAIEALLAAPATAAQRLAALSSSPESEPINIGAGLDLPNWLKRTAAASRGDAAVEAIETGSQGQEIAARGAPGFELGARAAFSSSELVGTEVMPPATTAPGSTAGGGLVEPPEPRDRLVASGAAVVAPPAPLGQVAGSIATTDTEPPLPPLPDGGLSANMPSWLRPGAGSATASAEPAAAAHPVPSSPRADLSARSLAEDPTDTTSFISEKDLPDWLRQLADAEAVQAEAAALVAAAQEAEQATQAAAVAAAEATAEAASAEALPLPEEATHLPGSSSAAGRWLTRHEPVDDAGFEHRSAFEDLVLEKETEQEAIAESASPLAARRAPEFAPATWATPAPTPEKTPSRSAESRGAAMWIVLGGLVLIIAALLAYMYANGQLG